MYPLLSEDRGGFADDLLGNLCRAASAISALMLYDADKVKEAASVRMNRICMQSQLRYFPGP